MRRLQPCTLALSLFAATAAAQTPSASFTLATDYELSESGPQRLTLADLDGDGLLDVAATQDGTDSGVGTITLAFGDGAGGFQQDATLGTLARPWAIAIGDLDGDGDADLVAADSGHDVRRVDVFLGDGAGGFALASSLTAGKFPVDLELADLDGDGDLDLAVAANVLDGVTVFLGNGDGTFGAPQVAMSSANATDLASGDLDEDGDLDLVVSTYSGVSVLLGNGAGGFASGGTAGSSGNLTEAVAVGDLNGDGHLDVASTLLYANQLVVRYGDGQGHFIGGFTSSTGSWPTDVRVRDVNADGLADLLCSAQNNGRVDLYLGTGGGGLLPLQQLVVGDRLEKFQLGDMDADGLLDVVALTAVPGENGRVVVLRQLLPAPTVYCTAKVTSNGCVPAMATSGTPSTTSLAPFWLEATQVRDHQAGMLFYGAAPASAPFSGGTLCVAAPHVRTGVQQSGGASTGAPNCSGTYAYDMNARLRAGLDPELVPGARVFAQYWFRDPGSPTGAIGLTDAVEFVVGP